MAEKTHTYQISVTVDHTGKQVHGLVFRDPVEAAAESHAFPFGDVWVNREDGSVGLISNDEGVLPYRERTQGPDEDLGLTWQLAK